MKKLVFIFAGFLAGCATSVPQETGHPTAAVQPVKPKAHIVGLTLEEMSTSHSCPLKSSADESEKDMMNGAGACVRTSQWKRVEEIGSQMSIRFSSSPWGPYFLSLSAEHAKDWPRARWMAELAVKNAPNEGLTLYQLGRIQWVMDEKETAFATLQKAVDKNSSLVEAQVLLGEFALIANRNSEAGRDFTKAIELAPKHFGALMGLSEVGFRNRAWTETEKYLRLAIQSRPRSWQARLRLAEAQEQLAKNNSEALQTYLEIQKLDRTHKLDGQPTIDLAARVHALQSSLAEELKRKLSADRQPSDQRKVSK